MRKGTFCARLGLGLTLTLVAGCGSDRATGPLPWQDDLLFVEGFDGLYGLGDWGIATGSPTWEFHSGGLPDADCATCDWSCDPFGFRVIAEHRGQPGEEGVDVIYFTARHPVQLPAAEPIGKTRLLVRADVCVPDDPTWTPAAGATLSLGLHPGDGPWKYPRVQDLSTPGGTWLEVELPYPSPGPLLLEFKLTAAAADSARVYLDNLRVFRRHRP